MLGSYTKEVRSQNAQKSKPHANLYRQCINITRKGRSREKGASVSEERVRFRKGVAYHSPSSPPQFKYLHLIRQKKTQAMHDIHWVTIAALPVM